MFEANGFLQVYTISFLDLMWHLLMVKRGEEEKVSMVQSE